MVFDFPNLPRKGCNIVGKGHPVHVNLPLIINLNGPRSRLDLVRGHRAALFVNERSVEVSSVIANFISRNDYFWDSMFLLI